MSIEPSASDPPPPLARGRRERASALADRCGVLPPLQAARRWLRRDLRVIAYHRVRADDPGFRFDPMLVSATPEAFHAQMRHLRDRYHPVRCEDVVAAIEGGPPLPRDAVLVTFDDGYDDNYRVAFPILRGLGVPATFFVATGHVDDGLPYAYDWLAYMIRSGGATRLSLPEIGLDAPLPPDCAGRRALVERVLDRLKYLDDDGQQALMARLERDWDMPRARGHADCRPMDWAQLREMRDAGMSIGGHGVHHRMLAKLPDEALRAELAECQARLSAELGAPAVSLSYPIGGPDAYDARVVAATADAGFRVGFTYVNGCNLWPVADRYALHRMSVERHVGEAWFRGMMACPELFSHPTVSRVYDA